VFVGAVHLTVASASPAVAFPIVGAPGAVATIPTAVLAVECTVSAVPWASV
jgi:hypothetical protein